jgi:iron complex outermembrane recepter protein
MVRNSNRGLRRAWLLSSALIAPLIVPPALAQKTDSTAGDRPQSTSNETTRTTEDGVETIIVSARNYVPDGGVTASKTDIPLDRMPQSISVVTRDQIDLLNFVDAQQAVRYVAGVTGENYGPDLRYDFITVRGFTPRQFVDGLAAPVSTTIQSVGVDLYAFDSFEVLKGPASVLYGTAPPGGIYNQMSRRASSDFGGELQAKYGSYDYKQIEGTLTGPLAEGLSARFTGLYLDRHAEREFVGADRWMAAPTFTWKIGERTTITGLSYYQHDLVDGDTNGFLPAVGTLLPNPLGQIDHRANFGEPNFNHFERNQWAAGWDAAHEFSDDISFHSNTKWSRYHEKSRVIYGGFLEADDRTLDRYSFPYEENVESFATDNRFNAKLETGGLSHNLLAGIDYRRVLNVSTFGFAFGAAVPSIDIFSPVYGNVPASADVAANTPFSNIQLKQTGVYAQDQIGIDKLYILLGIRNDWVSLDDRSAANVDSSQHKFTWRVGANYVLDNGLAPYVGYARSFEPVLGSDTTTDPANPRPFKPSSGQQTEGGVKFTSRDNRDIKLFGTVALFDIKQTNIVTTGTSIVPVFGTQTGEVEVYGGELELVARIREQLSINASYAYLHNEITKSDIADAIGQRLPTTPDHKVSLFVDYTLQKGMLGGLGFGAGVRYAGESAGGVPDAFTTAATIRTLYGNSSTLFDAIVHYDTPGWRFAVNGSNIFDKLYVARCSSFVGCTYGAGAQWIGTVTKKF